MCSRNSRASTSGRRTSLNTNNMKNKNYINRRMFASDASPFVSSTIGETKKKKKKKSKNAAASTASLSAAESSNEDEETEEEDENDSEDVNENKEDNKSSRLVFTTSENDENDTFRGNKAGRLSTQAISKRGGGQEGAAGKQTRTSFYKPMTSRAQIDGMNCEQLLEEIKQRFQSKKKPFLGGGNVPAAVAATKTKTKTGEKGGQNHPRTELEPSTIEIEGFKHEISERLASFLGFGEGESGVKATRRFVDRRLKSYCEEMNLFVGERDEREKKVKRMKDPENPGKWEDLSLIHI